MWRIQPLLVLTVTGLRIGCNDSDILDCRFQIIQGTALIPSPCDTNEEPSYANTSDPACCPSCMPPSIPYCAASQLAPICFPGQLPQVNSTTGCLTCRQFCTATRKALCKPAASVPSCSVQEPWYDPNCCPSCAPSTCYLNTSNVAACLVGLNATLPFCPDGVDGRLSFDPSTCCPVCRKPLRPTAPAPCTLGEFITCSNSSRECASGEEPLIENNQCCRHCRRPERRTYCLPEDVGECDASRPFCGVGQVPFVIEGECCKSCRLPLSPLCINGNTAVSCSSSQRCLFGFGGNSCRSFEQISIMFAANGLVPQLYLAHLGRLPIMRSDAGVGMAIELIHRYCDRTEFTGICSAFGSAAAEGLHATDPSSPLSASQSWYVVRTQYPVLPDWQCNASLYPQCATTSPAVSFLSFLNRAFADPEATNGLQVTIAYGAASSLHPMFVWTIGCISFLLAGM